MSVLAQGFSATSGAFDNVGLSLQGMGGYGIPGSSFNPGASLDSFLNSYWMFNSGVPFNFGGPTFDVLVGVGPGGVGSSDPKDPKLQ